MQHHRDQPPSTLRRHVRAALLLCAWLIGALSALHRPALAEQAETRPWPAWNPAQVREALPPLSASRQTPPSAAVTAYFKYYGLDIAGFDHRFGTFQSGPFTLAAHLFTPARPRGTVLLLHGYLDHSGTHTKAIRHLLEQGFAVAAYDLPGHGLSSGTRADIRDFSDYSTAFVDFLRLCRESMPPPYHVVAHSTGAAIVSSALLANPDIALDQVVLLAPLVRSAFWHLSTVAAAVFDPFIDEIPRVFRNNSSDPTFIDFTRRDPLQPNRTTIDWLQAIAAWNKRVKTYPPSPKAIVIIQGDEDSIIDWDYNLAFLKEKFPNARVEMIATGQHQLLDESPALRRHVLDLIDAALSTGEASPPR